MSARPEEVCVRIVSTSCTILAKIFLGVAEDRVELESAQE